MAHISPSFRRCLGRIAAVAVLCSLAQPSAAAETTFSDDFGDGSFTVANWFKDAGLIVDGAGKLSGGLTAIDNIAATANNLGCGDGIVDIFDPVGNAFYRNTTLTMSFTAHFTLAPDFSAIGGFLLNDTEHPSSPTSGVPLVSFGLFKNPNSPGTTTLFLSERNSPIGPNVTIDAIFLPGGFDDFAPHDFALALDDNVLTLTVDATHVISGAIPQIPDGTFLSKGSVGLFISREPGSNPELTTSGSFDNFTLNGELLCLTRFEDDFENAAFSEVNWMQGVVSDPRDDSYMVTPLGAFQGDNLNAVTPRLMAAHANTLGCASLPDGFFQGFNQYRNTSLTYSFDMRFVAEPEIPDPTPAADFPSGTAGASFLVDGTHPVVAPNLHVGWGDWQSGVGTMLFLSLGNGFAAGLGLTNENIDFVFLPPGAFDRFAWHHVEVKVFSGVPNAPPASPNFVIATVDGTHVMSGPVPRLQIDNAILSQGAAALFLSPGVTGGKIVEFDNVVLIGDEVCLANTPTGADVEVELIQGLSMTFDNVISGGSTQVTREVEAPATSPEVFGFDFQGEFFNIETDAVFSGPIIIAINYDEFGLTVPESELRLLHFNETTLLWEDTTILPVDTVNNILRGEVGGLSVFAIGSPAAEGTATFVAPLRDGTTQEAPAGPYKRGRTIPVKVRLLGGDGLPISDEAALGLNVRLQVFFEQPNSEGVPVDPGDNPPDLGDAFRYDAGDDLFIFNLSTKDPAWAADFTYGLEVLSSGFRVGEVFFSLR